VRFRKLDPRQWCDARNHFVASATQRKKLDLHIIAAEIRGWNSDVRKGKEVNPHF
jgi:hypothetical protein